MNSVNLEKQNLGLLQKYQSHYVLCTTDHSGCHVLPAVSLLCNQVEKQKNSSRREGQKRFDGRHPPKQEVVN